MEWTCKIFILLHLNETGEVFQKMPDEECSGERVSVDSKSHSMTKSISHQIHLEKR